MTHAGDHGDPADVERCVVEERHGMHARLDHQHLGWDKHERQGEERAQNYARRDLKARTSHGPVIEGYTCCDLNNSKLMVHLTEYTRLTFPTERFDDKYLQYWPMYAWRKCCHTDVKCTHNTLSDDVPTSCSLTTDWATAYWLEKMKTTGAVGNVP